MDEQEQPKRFRGIPASAQTTKADKRATQGVNLTKQAKEAAAQMREKYGAALRPEQ